MGIIAPPPLVRKSTTDAASSFCEIVVPAGGYIDNVLTLQNKSGTAAHYGCVALRLKDQAGLEQGAFGYGQGTDYFGKSLYAGLGSVIGGDSVGVGFKCVINWGAGTAGPWGPSNEYAPFEVSAAGDIKMNRYVGSNASTTAFIMKGGAGSDKGNIGINTLSPVNGFDVNAKVSIGYSSPSANGTNVDLAINNNVNIGGSSGVRKFNVKGPSVFQSSTIATNNNNGKVISATTDTATDCISFTYDGQGQAFIGYASGGVFGTDGSTVILKTGTTAPNSGTAQLSLSASRATFAQPVNLKSYTVATMPSGSAGDTAWASDCRAFNGAGVQEGAAAGTGSAVTYNGTAWKIAGTNVTAVA